MFDDQLEAAVTEANDAIRDYVRGLPRLSHLWTPAQAARYDQLLAAYGAAVRGRDAARAREGDDEAEPVAA